MSTAGRRKRNAPPETAAQPETPEPAAKKQAAEDLHDVIKLWALFYFDKLRKCTNNIYPAELHSVQQLVGR
jgi:hypothetical protein